MCLQINFSKHHITDTANVGGETFEELCRAHLRAFARGAEKYAAETQLSRRVGDWQSRLSPLLEEEEKRPEFDIHLYGDRIMQTVMEGARGRNPYSLPRWSPSRLLCAQYAKHHQ